MKARLQKQLEQLGAMRDLLQECIDNAGDSDQAWERADRNSTIVYYIESAIGELESAIAELE